MKTNLDFLATAVLYAVLGLALVFSPDQVLGYTGQEASVSALWFLQILGAAMLGLGWMNYNNRHSPIGGIYGKPLLLQNIMVSFPSFFFSVTSWKDDPEQPLFLVAAIVFGLITAAFYFRMKGRGPSAAPAK
jgi:hypothetical protein